MLLILDKKKILAIFCQLETYIKTKGYRKIESREIRVAKWIKKLKNNYLSLRNKVKLIILYHYQAK